MYRNLKISISILFILGIGLEALNQQPARRVEVLHANSLEYDISLGEGVRRLIGDVRIRHDDVYMSSDSAHIHELENLVLAYGNVHFNQGDTIHLYGDFVQYNGFTRLGEVRNNVRLVDKETTLTSPQLDFDLNRNLVIFSQGAIIQNAESRLESLRGYYFTRENDFFFSENVVVTHPDYKIYSDSLQFNTESEIITFHGPTRITSDDFNSYSEKGWYNQKTDQIKFVQNASIVNESQILRGDSIFYDRAGEFGRAINQVVVRDTIENILLKGNFLQFYRSPERMMITGQAEFIQVTDGDSLFLHADTLRSVTPEGEDYRILKAYNNARFFKSDIQGKCDSLVYNFRDSIIHMFVEPVLWFENSQLTAYTIHLYTKNRKMDYMHMPSDAFMVSYEGNGMFNQVKGKELSGYFNEGRLSHFIVTGNVETIYYIFEETENTEELIGVNKASSQQLVIRIKDNKPEEIVFLASPEGTLYPPGYLSEQEVLLQEFKWFDEIRPKNRKDIFRR